jgi:small multidrug resistance pump
MPPHILALIVAIACEVVGTTALQASVQFTRLGPSVVVVLAYGAAFFFLGMALKVVPVGIAYAIWSGLGIVLISIVGLVLFGQRLDLPAILGIGLILAGVLVIQLWSSTATH